MTFLRERNWFNARILVIFLFAAGTVTAYGQTEWVDDASESTIPTSSVTGRINGKPVTITTGRIGESGKIGLGSPELEFTHYTIRLTDGQTALDTRFTVLITLTVRKGEKPDGKTFRANLASSPEERSGLRGDGYWIPDIYSVTMESRRGTEFGSGIDQVTSSKSQTFTGRVELDKRKAGSIAARLYICYNDEQQSCIAGNVDLSIE